jgi:hypothetical protein
VAEEEVLRLVEMVGEGREVVGLRVLRSLVLVFFSTRQLGRALDASGGYEGRRVFTILPLASRQSRFLVASTPKHSPPASSSFSLWRAMCLSDRSNQPQLGPGGRSQTTTHLGDRGGGNERCSADMYYHHPCGSGRDGADARIWRRTCRSRGSCRRTSS